MDSAVPRTVYATIEQITKNKITEYTHTPSIPFDLAKFPESKIGFRNQTRLILNEQLVKTV